MPRAKYFEYKIEVRAADAALDNKNIEDVEKIKKEIIKSLRNNENIILKAVFIKGRKK